MQTGLELDLSREVVGTRLTVESVIFAASKIRVIE